MSYSKVIALVIGGAAFLYGAAFSATPAAAAACSLDLSKMKARVITGTTTVQTTSFTQVQAPGLSATFTQGSAGCVFIQLAADVATPTDQEILMRVELDGSSTGGTPTTVFFTSRTADQFAANSANFIFASVPAGAHTVRIVWSSFQSGVVKMTGRSLTVYYPS